MYDVAIIGGGPGGYAAALYAHNFGLSVALVEKDVLGGVCLNRGCIPAKAWLHAADVFDTVRRAGEFGIVSSEPEVDWQVALSRKNDIVDRLVRGITGLLESRKVELFDGFGADCSRRRCGRVGGRFDHPARGTQCDRGYRIGAADDPRLRLRRGRPW